jgi:hypothetical protein
MVRRPVVGDPGDMVGMRKVLAWAVIAVLVVTLVATLVLEAVIS